jgi:hypothetical protein
MTNYDELKTAVENWMHRSDLTVRIPEFIQLGEAAINRKLRVREMEESASVFLNTIEDYAALPAGYLEVVSFVDDEGKPLVALTPEELAKTNSSGKPCYYRISNRIDFERVPDSDYTFTLRYYKRLNIATDLTNAVLDNHPDIYLYSALLQAEPYIKNDARIQTWRAMLDGLIQDAHWNAQRTRRTLLTDISFAGTFNVVTG